MEPKQVILKQPFKRIKPYPLRLGITSTGEKVQQYLPDNTWEAIPQETFLSELSPSGHKINLRPDKRINDKTGKFLKMQSVAKIAVPLQKIIATKQKIHLASKDLAFTLTESERTKDKERLFIEFKQAWKDKNMHVALSKCIGSWLETGDAALYFYRKDKKLGWKDFSFKNGDVLLPHYDYFGNLETFGRLYASVGSDGKTLTMLDVFDSKYVTTFSKRSGLWGTIVGTVAGDWKEESRDLHGFSQIPICYKRSDDVCWGDIQPLADTFEEALSNLSENNRYYANSILFVTGTIKDLPGRDENAKILQGGADSKAQFLATPESNQAQMNEIEALLKQIFMGSFTVSITPDTIKTSGDLPGITVKLLFSPAIEKALDSAKELDNFIDKAVSLFKEGYGIEISKSVEYKNLKTRGEIDIYVPQNDAELVRVLNESIAYGSISKQTASEKNTYAINGEYDRIKEEQLIENAGTLQIQNTQI